MKIIFPTAFFQRTLFALSSTVLFVQCAEEHLLTDSETTEVNTLESDDSGASDVNDCLSCTYVVPEGVVIVDGITLGLQPGSVIGLDARIPYKNLIFRNIVGTHDKPIIIKNCGGTAQVDGTGKPAAIKTEKSEHFRITGGDVKGSYGILVNGGTMGINLGHFSNQFTVDHVEIQNAGFAGLMAKTDPSCDEASWRGNFLMKGVAVHNNYIHDTGGEGIYAGNSFYMGAKTACGEKLPHEIHYIRIFSNIIRNTGWEAIQLGCATKGASIHANTIENYGLADVSAQDNGIQIGTGTGGLCYNNLIKNGKGNGIIVLGLADNLVYNNVIDAAGNHGIFCDERYSPGPGFKFINNTILNPAGDGIRIYADEVPMNVIVNNVIMNPGNYLLHSYPRTAEDAFIYKASGVEVEVHNNYFTAGIEESELTTTVNSLYKFESTSPVVDQGADVSNYNIKTDFYYKARLKGLAIDIGAVEQY